MDDFVTEFNEKMAAKSREVCERIEREDAERRSGLSEVERAILDMWPKFEDGEYVWFGDVVKVPTCGAIPAEAIEFTAGKVQVKDAEDGDWNTSMRAVQPLKRPAPKVLDADGVEIKVGDTVWHCNGLASGVVTSIDADSLMHTTRYVDESGAEFRDAARNLTHTRPDSWGLLEEDAAKEPCFYFGFADKPCDDGAGCPANKLGNCSKLKASDIIRRAKALAGVEEARDED